MNGSTAPPAVVLSGPGAEHLIAPSDHPVLDRRYLVLHDQRTKATFVILRAPAAGRWTLSSPPGSASITAVHFATSLPPVSVKAHVSRNRQAAAAHLHHRSDPGPNGPVPRAGRQVAQHDRPGERRRARDDQLRARARPPWHAPHRRDRGTERATTDRAQRCELCRAWTQATRAIRAPARGPNRQLTKPHLATCAGGLGLRGHNPTSDGRAISTIVPTPRYTLLGVASLTTARAAVRSLDAHHRGPSASISVRAVKQRRSPHHQRAPMPAADPTSSRSTTTWTRRCDDETRQSCNANRSDARRRGGGLLWRLTLTCEPTKSSQYDRCRYGTGEDRRDQGRQRNTPGPVKAGPA